LASNPFISFTLLQSRQHQTEHPEMNVQIVEVGASEAGASGVTVKFVSPAGTAWARWMGERAPQVGREYSVELDVEGPVADYAPEEIAARAFAIDFVNEKTTLCGLLECVQEEGMGFFRLDPGCLVLIDTDSVWGRAGLWLRLTLAPHELEMSPIGE
jgi:hypothetical protein